MTEGRVTLGVNVVPLSPVDEVIFSNFGVVSIATEDAEVELRCCEALVMSWLAAVAMETTGEDDDDDDEAGKVTCELEDDVTSSTSTGFSED